ncbi:MAG: ABC transporter substrate-binding protein [Nitrososphaerales archaeon]
MKSEGNSNSMMEQATRLNKRKVIAGIQQKIDTMSPMQTQAGGIHGCVVYSIYEHFFYKAAQHGEMLRTYPLLLLSVEPIDKLQTFRLNIRRGVTFHNGDRLTSKDVMASIEAYSSTASIYDHFRDVTKMSMVDDHTLDMTWKENTLTNLTYLRHKRLPKIYSSRFLDSKGPAALESEGIGTGPMSLEEYVPGERVVLKRFPDYWGRKLSEQEKGPYQRDGGNIEELTIVYIAEPDAQVSALKKGEVDLLMMAEHRKVGELKESPNIQLVSSGPVDPVPLYINSLYKPLSDTRVRQAINYAIDREKILGLFAGLVQLAQGVLQPTNIGYDPKMTNYSFDPSKAKTLLNDAGYRDGFDITYAHAGRPVSQRLSSQITGMLQSVGLNAKVAEMDTKDYEKVTYDPNQTSIHLFSQVKAYDDESIQYFDYWHTKRRVRAAMDHPIIDELMDRVRTNPDEEARAQIYREASKYVMDNALMIWLLWMVVYSAATTKLKLVRWWGEGGYMPYMTSVINS